jgi:hypothetical protein
VKAKRGKKLRDDGIRKDEGWRGKHHSTTRVFEVALSQLEDIISVHWVGDLVVSAMTDRKLGSDLVKMMRNH